MGWAVWAPIMARMVEETVWSGVGVVECGRREVSARGGRGGAKKKGNKRFRRQEGELAPYLIPHPCKGSCPALGRFWRAC